jgi:hypothetical protein
MIYRHYKGGYYKRLCIAKHSETEEQLVIYQGTDGRIWARPRGMFEDQVCVDADTDDQDWVPRFDLVPFQSDPAGPSLTGDDANV